MKIFKPSKETNYTIWGFYIIFLIFFLIIGISAYHGIHDFSVGVGIYCIFFLIPIANTFFTYVVIDGNKKELEIRTLGLSHILTPVSQIKSISWNKSFGGGIVGVHINYENKHGKLTWGGVGQVYGKKQIIEIVKELVRLNPSIHVDAEIRKLAEL